MIKTFYKQIKNPSFDIPTWGLKINSDNKTINENIFFDYATINNLYIEKPEIKFKQLLSSISLNTGNIGLIKSVVGNFQFNNYMKDIKKTIVDCNQKINTYYTDILPLRKSFTKSFCYFNNNKSVYDHITSTTGRLKITEGINYLTLKKELKNNIKNSKGKILFEIDISSCEPNLLLSVLGKSNKSDLYEMFDHSADRSKLKLAVISTIYGMDINNCSKMTGIKKSTIQNIRNYFNIDNLKSYLCKEFEQHKAVKNIYGRHLIRDSNLLNHFIQSSAADYCILSFCKLSKDYNLNPIALIHDAFIFEIEKNRKNEIMNLSTITDPITNITLPINKRIISE